MDRYLWTQDKSIHDGKSMIVTKVAVAPKLRARELRLNREKRNRLRPCLVIPIPCGLDGIGKNYERF
jgi:hypothetical protein